MIKMISDAERETHTYITVPHLGKTKVSDKIIRAEFNDNTFGFYYKLDGKTENEIQGEQSVIEYETLSLLNKMVNVIFDTENVDYRKIFTYVTTLDKEKVNFSIGYKMSIGRG